MANRSLPRRPRMAWGGPAEGRPRATLTPASATASAATPRTGCHLRAGAAACGFGVGSSARGAVVVGWRRRRRLLDIVTLRAFGDALPELPDPVADVAAKRRQAAGSKHDHQHQDHDQVLVVHRTSF